MGGKMKLTATNNDSKYRTMKFDFSLP